MLLRYPEAKSSVRGKPENYTHHKRINASFPFWEHLEASATHKDSETKQALN